MALLILRAFRPIVRRLRLAGEAGMSTAEYAVGTIAAVAFAGVLLKVVTSSSIQQALTGIIGRALKGRLGPGRRAATAPPGGRSRQMPPRRRSGLAVGRPRGRGGAGHFGASEVGGGEGGLAGPAGRPRWSWQPRYRWWFSCSRQVWPPSRQPLPSCDASTLPVKPPAPPPEVTRPR